MKEEKNRSELCGNEFVTDQPTNQSIERASKHWITLQSSNIPGFFQGTPQTSTTVDSPKDPPPSCD